MLTDEVGAYSYRGHAPWDSSYSWFGYEGEVSQAHYNWHSQDSVFTRVLA